MLHYRTINTLQLFFNQLSYLGLAVSTHTHTHTHTHTIRVIFYIGTIITEFSFYYRNLSMSSKSTVNQEVIGNPYQLKSK